MQSVVVEQTHLCWVGICSKETYGLVIHHLPLTDRQTMRRWQRSGAKAPLSVTNMGKGAGTTSVEKYKNKRQNLLQSHAKLIPNHGRQIGAPKSKPIVCLCGNSASSLSIQVSGLLKKGTTIYFKKVHRENAPLRNYSVIIYQLQPSTDSEVFQRQISSCFRLFTVSVSGQEPGLGFYCTREEQEQFLCRELMGPEYLLHADSNRPPEATGSCLRGSWQCWVCTHPAKAAWALLSCWLKDRTFRHCRLKAGLH